jgi:hypothetical protein
MKPTKWTDAEFEVVQRKRWFSFSAVFWWTLYVGGFLYAQRLSKDPGEAYVYIVGAALIAPGQRLIAAVWRQLAQRISEPEEQLMRSRLLGREPTLWEARAARQAPR